MSAPVPPTVLAHSGHWAVDLAIYLGPLAVIAALVWVGERRRTSRGDTDDAN